MAQHPHNNDRMQFPDGLATYVKGLKQANGVPDPTSYTQFLKACGVSPGGPADLGDFENPNIVVDPAAPNNVKGRLNGPLGAFTGQLVGPGSEEYGAPEVPAAPALDSVEYAIELVECYWAAVLRDTPFSTFATDPVAQQAAAEMTALAQAHPGSYAGPVDGSGAVTPDLLFRGGLKAAGESYFAGETVGPYVSQFLLLPTTLGALPLAQKLHSRIPNQDYMTEFDEWNSIQNGNPPAAPPQPEFAPDLRYMTTGRDGASYTQVDELYQAYLVAYLVAGTLGLPMNTGSPYSASNPTPFKHQKAFNNFGGPDVAATLGAVARAALDAVWWQKWRVHLRHRPEMGGGIAHMLSHGLLPAADAAKLGNFDIVLGSQAVQTVKARTGGLLLPQSFPEGSPTHPAYPTGHGTVGGACVTVLKYFFDCDGPFPTQAVIDGAPFALPVTPSPDGQNLVSGTPAPITISGELHKLAHNISFGHGILAGIHWRSDTDRSILLGEAVAIKFLEEQTKRYPETIKITITKLNGKHHTFSSS